MAGIDDTLNTEARTPQDALDDILSIPSLAQRIAALETRVTDLESEEGDTTPPVFTSGTTASAVDGTAAGTVVYTAAATDASAVTYAITGADASSFTIGAISGTVANIAALDYATKPSHSFNVTATDAAGNTATRGVTLSVISVDNVWTYDDPLTLTDTTQYGYVLGAGSQEADLEVGGAYEVSFRVTTLPSTADFQFNVGGSSTRIEGADGVGTYTFNVSSATNTIAIFQEFAANNGSTGTVIEDITITARQNVVTPPDAVIVDDGTGALTTALSNFAFSSVQDMIDLYNATYSAASGWPILKDGTNQTYYGVSFAFSAIDWSRTYVEFHKHTGDSFWITRLDELVDYVFAMTDDNLLASGYISTLDYVKGPIHILEDKENGIETAHIGWAVEFNGQRRGEVLEDGNTCRWIMEYVHYCLSNNIKSDTTKLYEYIDRCVEIIAEWDPNFVYDRYANIAGSYYDSSRWNVGALDSDPLGYNHSTNICGAMYLINKYVPTAEYVNRYEAVFDFWTQFRTLNTGGSKGNYYTFAYGVLSDFSWFATEDINHGSYTTDFANDMLEEGLISTADVQLYLNGVHEFLTQTTCAHYVDGTGTDDGGDRVGMYTGWLDLALSIGDEETAHLIAVNMLNLHTSSAGFWAGEYAGVSKMARLIGLPLE